MGTPPSTARTRNVNRESLPSQIVAILAKMPVPMALLDVPGFRVQAANAPLLELTQMEAEAKSREVV